jgi:enamine deaminase RidA (YjgF/YER057c/UK114 family)
VKTGNLLFLAGKADGPYIGKVGRDVTIEEAYAYARQTGIQLLGVIAHELGTIDRVTQIVKVFGLVNATDDFTEHPKVMNGCSDLLEDVFGENGRHARTSVGAASLPGNIPVEIDMVVEFA